MGITLEYQQQHSNQNDSTKIPFIQDGYHKISSSFLIGMEKLINGMPMTGYNPIHLGNGGSIGIPITTTTPSIEYNAGDIKLQGIMEDGQKYKQRNKVFKENVKNTKERRADELDPSPRNIRRLSQHQNSMLAQPMPSFEHGPAPASAPSTGSKPKHVKNFALKVVLSVVGCVVFILLVMLYITWDRAGRDQYGERIRNLT